MLWRIFYSFIFLAFFHCACLSQESGSKSAPPKKDQSLKSKRKQRLEDKKKWKEERKNKRAEEKMLKAHHKRIQTKEVRKRMKHSKEKANRNNSHTREPFFQRLFNKKSKGKHSRQPKEKVKK